LFSGDSIEQRGFTDIRSANKGDNRFYLHSCLMTIFIEYSGNGEQGVAALVLFLGAVREHPPN
jgi:hypothetical protein